MKKLHLFMVLIMALIGTVITSCSNADEPQPEATPDVQATVYKISLALAGEYTNVSEEPMTRADGENPMKLYGVNVYCMKTDGSETSYSHYAYGVFDNVNDMVISLLGGYKYRFECTSVTEGDDKFYIDSYSYLPFSTSYMEWVPKNAWNKFIVSSSNYLPYLGFGYTTVKYGTNEYTDRMYPRMDRFYGELNDFVPSEGCLANIPMKRTVFGLKIIANGVPDGTLSWSIDQLNNNKTCTGSDIVEETTIYTFYDVRDCWSIDTYTQNFTINFTWTRSNGYEQYFSKEFTAKRNIMTTINVNLKGGANDVSLGIEEDDTPMGNEGVNVDYDGGDLNDTPVNPQE